MTVRPTAWVPQRISRDARGLPAQPARAFGSQRPIPSSGLRTRERWPHPARCDARTLQGGEEKLVVQAFTALDQS